MSIVSLEDVSKKYRIFPSTRDQLKRVLSFGKSKAGHEFWALKDVNLKVEPGTALGILGRNGAGKSTLLKVISGVLQPTYGKVRVDGRLVALLQLGAGFNDEFTGRENVILNGLILGIDRKEMLSRFDEIAAFADIGEFMNQPLKTYSSGMRARLGFAVAVNVRPDILLVDESLSTGDAVFKTKGIQKMRELRDSGATILFVSHSTNQVRNFCTEATLLHKGSLVARGDTSEVIDHYQALVSKSAKRQNGQSSLDQPSNFDLGEEEEAPTTPDPEENSAIDTNNSSPRHGTGEAKIQSVEVLDERGSPVNLVDLGSLLTVRAHVRYAQAVEDSAVGIVLRNKGGLDIFSTSTTIEGTPVGSRGAGEQVIVNFSFRVPLKHGRYSVAAFVSRSEAREDIYVDRIEAAAVFKMSRPSGRGAYAGLVHLPTQIRLEEPDRAR